MSPDGTPTNNNPLTSPELQRVLQPMQDALSGAVNHIQQMSLALLELHTDVHKHRVSHFQSAIYTTVDDNGGSYEVRYEGRKFMDVMAFNTSDITANITMTLLIPGLGQSPLAVPLVVIGIYNMLHAGVSPWTALNLPEGTTITISPNPVANQQELLLVRYGMESWGMR